VVICEGGNLRNHNNQRNPSSRQKVSVRGFYFV